jgi:predicted  nucleic acid-binding Zn-ribbon protein
MPSNSDRVSSDDIFRKIEAKLALIRAAATAPPDPPESWRKRTFNPAPPSSRQNDFNVAVVDALEEAVAALRETVASQEVRLEHLERDLTELRSLSASLRELRERSATAETQLAQLRQEHSERIEQLGHEQREKINQQSAGQGDLGSELRERIQHLLDEQRVCIRQLSLKTSEEAVLADRARRATELRLEELARRIPERPA